MATPIKLGVIGAGSATFSLGVIKDICLRPGLAGSAVTLMDVDRERLEPMLAFARRYAEELGADVSFDMTPDRAGALRDADFVINTAQVGGHSGVEALREFAESYGYYRGFQLQSPLNIRLMLSVARDMERLCPDAWLIQAGNPVFEGCTAMTRETGIKVCGICHGHFGYRDIARVLGLDPDRVTMQAVGFNHWIFLTHFEHEGRDAYPLLDRWIAEESERFWQDYHPRFYDNQMSPAAVGIYRLAGLFPVGDTPRLGGWWFHSDLETKRRWYGSPLGGFDSELGWAEYLRGLDEEVAHIHEAVADPGVRLTELFRPEPTGEQHFPLIEALVNDVRAELQVNVPNRGAIEGLPDDIVVEVPALCSARGIQPYHVGRLPETVMATMMWPRLVAAERMVQLAIRPDPRTLMALILEDHRTRSYDHAVEFCRAILARPEYHEIAAEMAARCPGFP